tara:strand:+ start:1009 stop:1938 length:930 start_codon:yes stop_codon:yes gene_type:complete
MKKLIILLFIPLISFGQMNGQSKLNLENKKEKIFKFSDVESAPFYIDWCASNLAEDKMRGCTDSGIKLFAKQNFDTGLANELKLSGFQRITSAFTINKNGDIINIRVRAPHPKLEDEAVRVINLLPKMEPGRQNGKAVSVSYLLPIIFKVQSDSLTQSEKKPILNVIDGDNVEVSFFSVENAPIYPGCEKRSGEKRRRCMSEKISKFVRKKFNTKLAGDYGLSGRQRISVIFKIDKLGDVVDIRARAPHPKLEDEAIRVINLLPKMKPGMQLGKAVIVPYSLPIIFQVKEKEVVREYEYNNPLIKPINN